MTAERRDAESTTKPARVAGTNRVGDEARPVPREVTHTARGPRKLTREDFENEKENVAVCRCGLSDGYPFCDGTHRRTEDEDDDALYKYVDGERRVVAAVEYADADEANAGAEKTDVDAEKTAGGVEKTDIDTEEANINAEETDAGETDDGRNPDAG